LYSHFVFYYSNWQFYLRVFVFRCSVTSDITVSSENNVMVLFLSPQCVVYKISEIGKFHSFIGKK